MRLCRSLAITREHTQQYETKTEIAARCMRLVIVVTGGGDDVE